MSTRAKEWVGVVTGNREAGGFHVLTLRLPAAFPNAPAGTFLMLSVGHEPETLLRRPMAFYDIRKARRGTAVDILYAIVGKGTKEMTALKKGTPLSLLGPIGNHFSKPSADEDVTVVAGGVGIAPFLLWGRQSTSAQRKRSRVLLGFRNRSQLPIAKDFRKVGVRPVCAVEGAGGDFRGTVVDLLEQELRNSKPDRILTCGPEIMMQRVCDAAMKKGIPVELSLETKMGCGVGACLSCVTPYPKRDGTAGYALACQDGPIFVTH